MTPHEVIRKYLIEAPEQSDWPWEDHCDGLAGGLIVALRAHGYLLDGTTGEPTENVFLSCEFCGHWEDGPQTKAQIAQWLRVHKNARLGVSKLAGRKSTCPHPCGTPFVGTTGSPTGDKPVTGQPEPCPTCGGKREIQGWDSGGSWWSDCPDCTGEAD